MFREYLLESSSLRPNRKRWPMAIAFVLECVAAAIVICIPLLSSGVIPVAARVPRRDPLPLVRVAQENSHQDPIPGGATGPSSQRVVVMAENHNAPYFGPEANYVPGPPLDLSNIPLGPGRAPDLACPGCGHGVIPGRPHNDTPRLISHLDPAQLIFRVEPVYPKTAVLINLQGEVKLHALIAKDGTVQSLSVTSGHPLLAQAALDAVRQWRYRPYVLNGEAVEVETFITVNFRRDH